MSLKNYLVNKKPIIMGILNITPDSFSDGGKYFNFEDTISHAKELIKQGVDIIDIGGESTRPGAEVVSEEEELRRVIPIVKRCRDVACNVSTRTILISIDTYKSNVAKKAIEAGANIINDVSGLTMDPDMVHVAAKLNCKVVIMHNRGIPATKPREVRSANDERRTTNDERRTTDDERRTTNDERRTTNDELIKEVYNWLKKQTNFAIANGVKRENIIIDPGIGFGKTPQEDLAIIENLKEFKSLGFPVMVGPSRKSFIKKLFREKDFESKNKEMIELCIKNGADIIRVH